MTLIKGDIVRTRRIRKTHGVAQYVKGGRIPVSVRLHPDVKRGVEAIGRRIDRNTSELLEAAAKLLLSHPDPAALFLHDVSAPPPPAKPVPRKKGQ